MQGLRLGLTGARRCLSLILATMSPEAAAATKSPLDIINGKWHSWLRGAMVRPTPTYRFVDVNSRDCSILKHRAL